MFRRSAKARASATPTQTRLLPFAFALGLVLLTLLLCRASSLIKPHRVASQVQVTPSELAAVRDSVEKKGLEATRVTADNGSAEQWSFQNLRHRFAASFSEHGWQLSPILTIPAKAKETQDEAARWSWRYELTSLARGSDSERVGSPVVSAAGSTITLDRSAGIREWYKNSLSGIEQGFEIKERPIRQGSAELILRGTIETDLSVLSTEPDSLTFGRSGQALVRYAELLVLDSTGKKLPSSMSFSKNKLGGELALYIDDSQATYPVTVDPVTSSPLWTEDGPEAGYSFGFSVASAGDVNGDGFADVVVGAPHPNGNPTKGAVYLFLGSLTGPPTTPSSTIEGNMTHDLFGHSVSSAGDVNGDGYSDVIVGAPGHFACGMSNIGLAELYLGSPSGLDPTPAWERTICQGYSFGWSVSTAGDVNNDGYSDVIVGCPGCLSNFVTDGNAYVYYGSSTGLDTLVDWTFNTDDLSVASAEFGSSVASAGDVDSDGFSDVIVGAYLWQGVGRAFLFRGSAAGLSNGGEDWSFSFAAATHTTVAGAGDVNGDGFDDVLVGGPEFNFSGQNGTAQLFLGSAAGLATIANWSRAGSNFDANTTSFGAAVASAGDINADGYDDILVSSSDYGFGPMNQGRAFLFLGSATGPPTTEAWIATGEGAADYLGTSLTSAGDVNGDGFPDIIIGSPGKTTYQGQAAVWSDFNIERTLPTATPTPTPTPIAVFPGGSGLPAPVVTTSNTNATISAPQVTPQLTTRARNAAINKLMRLGLTRAQAIRALLKLSITYIFTVSQGGGASAAGGDNIHVQRSSITRRTKRNTITYNNLAPGGKSATYRIEIATRKPPVVLGVTKPSGKTPFTITRSFTTTRN